MDNKNKLNEAYRIEHDTMGEIKVPADKYWGAQTQRSLENFKIGSYKMPPDVIKAFAYLKKAAAIANTKHQVLTDYHCDVISTVCDEIIKGELDDNFPLVIFQTGSGTQTNMNFNEVIANRGNEILKGTPNLQSKVEDGKSKFVPIHPNDHVNKSQSSNDTFPTAMHVAATIAVAEKLIPAASMLRDSFLQKEREYMGIVKTGRTHLQDAAPLTLGQEISGWRSMLDHDINFIEKTLPEISEIALGGTAVGTGLNAPLGYDETVAREITQLTGHCFVPAENKFHSLTSKGGLVLLHGAMKALAGDLLKIANDVRWLASGPRCGIGEIIIPENEPGSSIMPGKVNPTQCEALSMVCLQIMGNDTTIGMAASQGNFQLNVYMPLIIHNFLESTRLLTEGMNSFRVHCVDGIMPSKEKIRENLDKSLMLVTALNPKIGYEAAAKIAKKAHAEGRTLRDVALELGLVTEEEFDKIVDPSKMVGRI